MKIRKKLELKFNGSSIYTLNKIGKNFLINKNYGNTTDNSSEEFLLINEKLEIIARTNIHNGHISIYQVFACEDGNRFLVYSCDPYLLLYGDFLKGDLFTVDIENIKDKSFSHIYLWLENSILILIDEEIYEFNIFDKKLKKIEMGEIKKSYADFYIFQKECQKHMPIKYADFINKNYIYLENYLNFDGNYNAVYVDHKNKKMKKIEDIRNKYYDYHDIIFHKGYFILVAEEILTIIKDKKTYTYPMRDKSYIFAKASGIDNNEKLSFIVLERYQGCEEKSDRLVRYELS